MVIFLTGGSGFIGKKFINKALEAGHFIYCVSRKNKKNKKNLVWLKGDISKSWNKYLKRSDVLIHMSAAGVYKKNISYKEAINVNLLKPRKLLINAINSKCFNWVIIGSASEYGRNTFLKKNLSISTKALPETNYEKSKFYFTQLCLDLSKKYKIKCRVMRLFNVYGEGENKKRLLSSLRLAAKSNKNFKMTSGKQIVDFINVEDAAKIILDSANFNKKNNHFPQIWHVASGKPKTVKSFAKHYWKKYKAKGKLFFNPMRKKDEKSFISDQKSIWKIK
tara:strand:- start:170 stop:1003 length:834 start_codon:yes stop_codon:yes gene_type:complete